MNVKICGITTLEDALLAVEMGASSLGFNFYTNSPRYISPQDVAYIINALPADVRTIGVFVNTTRDSILEIQKISKIEMAQLHGDESIEFCREIPMPVIKAVRPHDNVDIQHINAFTGLYAVLVDAASETQYGGTGKRANWSAAQKVAEKLPTILAGGLNAENILDAIATVRPMAIDICSGVESSPGRKSHEKMRAFFGTLKLRDK